jgi:hypothetical protein
VTICTPWRAANSLNQLLAQVNAEAPNRKKGADGTIGDPAHQKEMCSSQHNSCCVKVGGIWIIRAEDFTHDPAGGFDSYAFAEALRLSHDPRIRYIISHGRITSASRGWQWEHYDGSDPHDNHAHVSVWDDQPRFDDTSRAWKIAQSGDDDMSLTTDQAKQLADASWALTSGEYGPEQVRWATAMPMLKSLVASAAADEARDKALQTAFDALVATIKAGGGNVDAAPILAAIQAQGQQATTTVAALADRIGELETELEATRRAAEANLSDAEKQSLK